MFKLKTVLITVSMLMLVVSLQPGTASADSVERKVNAGHADTQAAKVARISDASHVSLKTKQQNTY